MVALKTFLKLAFGGFLLALLVVVATVVYFEEHDFPPYLTHAVERQLLQRGIAAQFKSIRLEILRGVIASDAELADAREPGHVLARIDRLQIRWDWPRLLRGENAISDLRIANANVVVPTPADEIGPEVFTAAEASATLRLAEDGVVEVDQLTGIYCGIRMRMDGQIKLRGGAGPEEKSDRSESVCLCDQGAPRTQ